jgi:hypothetical protein
MYSSACFGRPHAHYQDLNNCSSSLWFYRWSVVVAVLLVVIGPVNRVPKRKGICFAAAEKLSAFEGPCATELIAKVQTFL